MCRTVIKARSVNMKIKKGKKAALSFCLSFISQIWTWNVAHQSQICTVELSWVKGAYDVSIQEGESNGNKHEKFGMSVTAKGMNFRTVEWIECVY